MPADPTLEELLRQEQDFVLDHFDYDMAWRLGSRIRELAAARQAPVAIEVTHGAAPAFLTLLPGASPDNLDWVRRKRMVVLRFNRSSLYMRIASEAAGVDFNARYRLSPEDYVASGGGVPLIARGIGVVGVASVSGLPNVEDHGLVIEALASLRS